MGSVRINEKLERAPLAHFNCRICAYCFLYKGFRSYFVCKNGSTAIKTFESHVFSVFLLIEASFVATTEMMEISLPLGEMESLLYLYLELCH